MTLILNNEEVGAVLSMDLCLKALEEAYIEEAHGRAINQIRHDTEMPISSTLEGARHEFKTMVGLVPAAGVSAIRLSSGD